MALRQGTSSPRRRLLAEYISEQTFQRFGVAGATEGRGHAFAKALGSVKTGRGTAKHYKAAVTPQ